MNEQSRDKFKRVAVYQSDVMYFFSFIIIVMTSRNKFPLKTLPSKKICNVRK